MTVTTMPVPICRDCGVAADTLGEGFAAGLCYVCGPLSVWAYSCGHRCAQYHDTAEDAEACLYRANAPEAMP